ncbi:Metallo-dependent phosphatase [Mycena olivaceomarginata]|nr:Metallo-dependent phosphatase [Mycena olivaceomarginata]
MSKPVAQNTDGTISGKTVLNIAHFNDVYQVSDQKIYPGGKEEIINVTKFASSLFDITSNWKEREDGSRDGLTVFSGDVFSPSTESSVTRGRHMPLTSRTGNHEFDFGYPQLKTLLADTRFPWLLSNILDTNTGKVPEPLKDAHIIEKADIRIGLIGLVEKDWIATITGWPENFEHQDMAKIGKELSVKLRDPAGEYKCDLIIAVTHSFLRDAALPFFWDIKLAKALSALSPTAQAKINIASEHGVDLLLAGHDHFYWISKGVTEWDGYDLQTPHPDAKDDQGDVLVVKSGTDFQDISEVILTLKDAPAGSIRIKLIQEIRGKRHVTRGTTAVNEDMKVIFDHELKTVSDSMSKPVCITDVLLDVQAKHIRMQESLIGNWVTDCLRPAYDEALAKLGYNKVDGVIIDCGVLRGGHIYQPGFLTLGDLTTILPFSDSTIVVEVDANTLWDTVESGLSRYPSPEGCFPAISGFRVSWDSRKPAGNRVLGIWLLGDSDGKLGPDGKPVLVDKEEILRTSTRKYLIMTREYMYEGGDGYDVLKGKKLVITTENGQTMSALIRKFLLGQLQKWQSLPHLPQIKGLPSLPKPSLPSLPSFSPPSIPTHSFMPHAISIPSFAQPKLPNASGSVPSLSDLRSNLPHLPNVSDSLPDVSDHAQKVLKGVVPAIRWLASRALLAAALLVGDHEEMGLLDAYERHRARVEVELMRADPNTVNNNLRLTLPTFFAAQTQSRQDVSTKADEKDAKINAMEADAEKALPVIHPVVDGRLKDVASG